MIKNNIDKFKDEKFIHRTDQEERTADQSFESRNDEEKTKEFQQNCLVNPNSQKKNMEFTHNEGFENKSKKKGDTTNAKKIINGENDVKNHNEKKYDTNIPTAEFTVDKYYHKTDEKKSETNLHTEGITVFEYYEKINGLKDGEVVLKENSSEEKSEGMNKTNTDIIIIRKIIDEKVYYNIQLPMHYFCTKINDFEINFHKDAEQSSDEFITTLKEELQKRIKNLYIDPLQYSKSEKRNIVYEGIFIKYMEPILINKSRKITKDDHEHITNGFRVTNEKQIFYVLSFRKN